MSKLGIIPALPLNLAGIEAPISRAIQKHGAILNHRESIAVRDWVGYKGIGRYPTQTPMTGHEGI
jgi:hypothetical protein